MSYLDIARAVVAEREESEKSEISLETHQGEHLTGDTSNELHPRQLSPEDAVALGLNPDLRWIRVNRDDVEACVPPANWDGTLPEACGWRSLCRVLGPCSRRRAGGGCRIDGDRP
jgi:hypothetical protein